MSSDEDRVIQNIRAMRDREYLRESARDLQHDGATNAEIAHALDVPESVIRSLLMIR